MSNDRELLGLAAKAAGLVNYRSAGFKTLFVETGSLPGEMGYYWNPLTDDGDALRLAVKLGVLLRTDFLKILAGFMDSGIGHAEATRRAIVCIAAEIGRAMP